MFRSHSTGTCRQSLLFFRRTKSNVAFERDAAPHQGRVPFLNYTKRRVPTPTAASPKRVYPEHARRRKDIPSIPPVAVRTTTTPTTTMTTTRKTVENPSLSTIDEFFRPPGPVSDSKGISRSEQGTLPTEFTSPPLLPGLVNSLKELISPFAKPTPIQSLSLKHILQEQERDTTWRQFLLASETGSGKSIAYLLPVLQAIKQAEMGSKGSGSRSQKRMYNPRGLILAPTHELARQLTRFAKALLHNETRLRVICASQTNTTATTTRSMVEMMEKSMEEEEEVKGGGGGGEFRMTGLQNSRRSHPVDLIIGTPMKVLDMVRGRGWDRTEEKDEEVEDQSSSSVDGEQLVRKPRRGRDFAPGFGKSPPELGLGNVEWVVVDEADVLFDPDFEATTRLLLSDITSARETFQSIPSSPATPPTFPFNLILTTATIPTRLSSYLFTHHPSLTYLSSPNLHRLPKTIKTEYVPWSSTGGGPQSKFKDVMAKIKRVWAEDSASHQRRAGGKTGGLSKILIFVNRSTKVVDLSTYLSEQGIANVPITSKREYRGASLKHLSGFLNDRRKSIIEVVSTRKGPAIAAAEAYATFEEEAGVEEREEMLTCSSNKKQPLVLITTSLLSRGLDFSPDVRHVFLFDEPRNKIDFLHRAGRSGRAGREGVVVVFGKSKKSGR